MRPAQAIKIGFTKSFQFSGRASRSEFWWFVPVALVPPVLANLKMSWSNFEFWGIWRVGILILLSLPLIAAMSRRLQDVGEPGHQAIFPFMPFVLFWLAYQVIYWFSTAAVFTGLATGLGMVIGILALIAFGFVYVGTVIAALFTTASIIGMMLVASNPRSNRYGPPPSEVTL